MTLTKKYRVVFNKKSKVVVMNPFIEYTTNGGTTTFTHSDLDGQHFDTITEVETYIENNELLVIDN